MKTHSLPRSTWRKNLALACAATVLVATSSANAAGGAPKAYRFTSSATNTAANVMTLDHPSLNGKPALRLIATQYFTGVYNPHPIGVAYNAGVKKWQILNEDDANIPVNANFNVMIAPTAKRISVTPTNANGLFAFFPTQKGNADAKLLVTHMINPIPTLAGVRQTNAVSVFFYPPTAIKTAFGERWTIYQANGDPNIAAVYNIADATNLKVGGNVISFRHSARDANTTELETTITNPLTDGKPDAVLFIQPVFTQAAPGDVDEVMGVRYADGKWRIITQDQADKMVPVDFNIVAFPAVTP